MAKKLGQLDIHITVLQLLQNQDKKSTHTTIP